MKAELALRIFFLVLAGQFTSGARSFSEEKFVGWMGEVYNPRKVDKSVKIDPALNLPPEDARAGRWIQHLSVKPRAYLFRNFITDEEADYMIRLALPQMQRSTVEKGGSDAGEVTDYRSSYGMFFRRNMNDVLKNVQSRIANWTHIPEVHQEDMQILRYTNGQEYRPHLDTLLEDDGDGIRIATVIIYLKDLPKGGETAFVSGSQWADENIAKEYSSWSECANGHVAVKPRKGDALLFYSLLPSGEEDPTSEHAGCPVPGDAVKWTATVWIRTHPFRISDFNDPNAKRKMPDPGDCEDYPDVEKDCANLVNVGYCEKDPGLMIGNTDGVGLCRKSCGACTVCALNDRQCYLENRRKANFLFFEELWPENGTRMPLPHFGVH